MNFVNLTPHDVVLNNGTVYPKTGTVARVSTTKSQRDSNGVAHVQYGDPTGIPDPAQDALYIVSAIVMDHSNRTDLVAPDTGDPECRKSEDGKIIISVPGFISK